MMDWFISSTGTAVGTLYALGLSISCAAITVELVYSKLTHRPLYRLRDTAANIGMYAGFLIINSAWVATTLTLYTWVSDHAVIQLGSGGWHLGQHGRWWEWVALILLEDLCFYTFHRFSHRSRLLWASHVSHHSSKHFNLSVAFRQTWMPFLGVVFWFPLLLIGFDPLMVLTVQLGSLFFQELLHTQVIGRLGILEWVFNTPRHHAIHHGCNPCYLDKNYAGVFIIWDRLFGTFAEYSEPIQFGVTDGCERNNPLVIAFHEWIAMLQLMVRTPGIQHRVRTLFAPPGSSPGR